MRSNHISKIVLVFLFVQSTLLNAQEQWTKSKAVDVTNEARDKANHSQFKDAIAQLDQSIAEVSSDAKLKSYHSYFLFSKAYLYENNKEGNEKENLKAAQQAYEAALALQPGDLKILKNLILVSRDLEDESKLIKYCELAFEIDQSLDRGKWPNAIGDYYKNKGDNPEAYKFYERGMISGNGNREAAMKLVAIYETGNPEYLDKYFETCKKMNEVGLAEIAADGFVEVFNLTCRDHTEVNEDMILYWAGILVKNSWVLPRLEKQLANTCSFLKPIDQIKNNISKGWQHENLRSNWWGKNNRRSYYYHALQKSWADYQLSIGQKKEAAKLYDSSSKNIEYNNYSKELFGKEDVLEIDLYTQLARLYDDKEIDPNGDKFDDLERRLFGAKGGAYSSGNLEAIQKFHTILGLIYVERKQWDKGYAQNAKFQLSRAISTSKKRAEKDSSTYAALPHLHQYLGRTYDALNKSELAAESYLNSAEEYLETNNLRLSEEMMATAEVIISTNNYPKYQDRKRNLELELLAKQNSNLKLQQNNDSSIRNYNQGKMWEAEQKPTGFPITETYADFGNVERKIKISPRTPSLISKRTGKIVINVCLYSSGRIETVELNQEASTIEETNLIKMLINHVKRYRFEPSHQVRECGTLNFIFQKR